jgi:signal transduction histidine kinase
MTSAAGLRTQVEIEGRPRRLPALVDLAAYRIVQESLTNALRYAGPASARVSLGYRGDHLAIEISDDGRGSGPGNTAGQEQGSGQGITGMRERAAAVGSRLEAGPCAEGGFCVRASLPFLDRA